jgi:putative glycosyltransferase
MNTLKLSIVTTLYKSSDYVDEFYTRITIEAKKITSDYEIIFVDDGSPDDSLQKAINLSKIDKRLKVIELSRNFGHHKAIMTGLSYAKGDYVFLIDCDLEEEPEYLGIFWNNLQMSVDLDVIYGVQDNRKGKFFERWSGKLYYKIFNYMADEGHTAVNFTTVRLMSYNYVQKITLFKEKDFFFAPISELTGFNQKPITVNKLDTGSTTYTIFHKYNMLINSIFTFSIKPLYFIFYFGLLTTLFSFIFVIEIVIRKLVYDLDIEGWTSLVASIWLLGGITISFLGIISIYISKIFTESKNRPFSIIKNIYMKKK